MRVICVPSSDGGEEKFDLAGLDFCVLCSLQLHVHIATSCLVAIAQVLR
jgi:hypothetical protein